MHFTVISTKTCQSGGGISRLQSANNCHKVFCIIKQVGKECDKGAIACLEQASSSGSGRLSLNNCISFATISCAITKSASIHIAGCTASCLCVKHSTSL